MLAPGKAEQITLNILPPLLDLRQSDIFIFPELVIAVGRDQIELIPERNRRVMIPAGRIGQHAMENFTHGRDGLSPT